VTPAPVAAEVTRRTGNPQHETRADTPIRRHNPGLDTRGDPAIVQRKFTRTFTILDAMQPIQRLNDDGTPRDSAFKRWTSFMVIMTIVGIAVAGVVAWLTYSTSADGRDRYGRRDATPISDQQWEEVMHQVRRNALIGFGFGAALGSIYVVKCLVRDEDP
jgi:hypothetical protein